MKRKSLPTDSDFMHREYSAGDPSEFDPLESELLRDAKTLRMLPVPPMLLYDEAQEPSSEGKELKGKRTRELNQNYIESSDKIHSQEYDRENSLRSLRPKKEELYAALLGSYHYTKVSRVDSISRRRETYYVCQFGDCRKEFLKAWNMLDHARSHEGIRPFTCDKCGKSFTQKCNLTKHSKKHQFAGLAQRKVFSCPVCLKSFTEKYNMRAHMQKNHS